VGSGGKRKTNGKRGGHRATFRKAETMGRDGRGKITREKVGTMQSYKNPSPRDAGNNDWQGVRAIKNDESEKGIRETKENRTAPLSDTGLLPRTRIWKKDDARAQEQGTRVLEVARQEKNDARRKRASQTAGKPGAKNVRGAR